MGVVLTMTGVAILRRHDLRGVPRHVASVAIEIAVRSRQGVARLGVVIKAPPLPTVRVVAQRTIRAQATVVMLIPVTFDTIQWRILEGRRAMTFFARHDRMASDQRKSCEIMIESSRAAPIGLAVAALAIWAKLSLVPVVFQVTGNARRGELVAIEIASVTGIALDLGMRSLQRIFGILVVIEANRTPLAFVMAAFAPYAVASSVDVLNLVTVNAGRTDSLVALSSMARGAEHSTVRIPKRKLRGVVVERLDTTPLRLAVAFVAGLAQATLMRIARLVTVETSPGRVAKFDRLRVTASARY